jgi:hypothetical protein
VVEPARVDMNCCAVSGIILSSVTSRYQLGLVFWRKRGDVHEPCDFWIGAGFSNYRAAVRVTDQNDRTGLVVDHEFRSGNVAAKRYRWILYDADVEAVLFEDVVDIHPAGAVYERAVDKDDVVDLVRRSIEGWSRRGKLAIKNLQRDCATRDAPPNHPN